MNPRYLSTAELQAHAEHCARTILRYWTERGYDPEIEIPRGPRHCDSSGHAVYVIRSNMINGVPTRAVE